MKGWREFIGTLAGSLVAAPLAAEAQASASSGPRSATGTVRARVFLFSRGGSPLAASATMAGSVARAKRRAGTSVCFATTR